jgi:hypothetical protein
MKLSLVFLLLVFSISSFAECNRETQFIGTVKNLTVNAATPTTVEHYSYQIKLGHNGNYWFSASGVCPMWEDELESATVEVAGKPYLANGDAVSGVLVFDQELQDYKLD